jgi:hypothetical protein
VFPFVSKLILGGLLTQNKLAHQQMLKERGCPRVFPGSPFLTWI